jgi:hypothetical protein
MGSQGQLIQISDKEGKGMPLSTTSNALDVSLQDTTSPPFQYFLMREDKTDITLTSAVTKGDTVIAVSVGHGFTAGGEYMVIMENDLYLQTKVMSVSTNDITIQNEVGNDFTTGATVIRGVIEMDVDGSSTPVDFIFNMRQGVTPIDIQAVVVSIWNAAAAGDDGKFGDLTALTNGIRFVKENAIDQGLGTYRTNSDFREFGAVVEYNPRSGGGGNFGVDVIFDVKKTYGVVLRIDPAIPEIFKGTVRDALQTLDRVRVSIMGQYTVGE